MVARHGGVVIVLVYAHPYPQRSRANAALLQAAADLQGVKLHMLYDLYPDFAIDVEAEQRALRAADVVVWQHPLYWYSVPALLKLWFDKVLALGFAYGQGGTALHGKRCQWMVTTGGDPGSYGERGMHEQPFDHFVAPIEQTARFCGMRWQPPLVLHGAHRVSDRELHAAALRYRERLIELGARHA
jgi:glutathione-regulated potassium-efflux system ancillary protein KefF